jgi:hypothetical protein
METGGLAQLARAPALHAGGQRFESVILHLVEKNGCGMRAAPVEAKTVFWMMFDMSVGDRSCAGISAILPFRVLRHCGAGGSRPYQTTVGMPCGIPGRSLT